MKLRSYLLPDRPDKVSRCVQRTGSKAFLYVKAEATLVRIPPIAHVFWINPRD